MKHKRYSSKYPRRKFKKNPYARFYAQRGKKNPVFTKYIGIDGEGHGQEDHRYILLAASDSTGTETSYVESKDGTQLSTIQCLDFILSLAGKGHKIFSYSFNYDLTKILTDVDNETLWLLFRPEERQREGSWAKLGPRPVKWRGYELNLQGTKFTLKKDGVRVVIWDLFKFFQSKFVVALKAWKVGNKELHERMEKMKNKRDKFDYSMMDEIRKYCLEECMCMGQLAKTLVTAHEEAGLELKAFYGAGSSSAAMLKYMGVDEHIVPIIPEMKNAVACSFFGGRFENSAIGAIEEHVYNKDISSAYPYHTTFLPCLVHGTWKFTKHREHIENNEIALVNYGLDSLGIHKNNPNFSAWGPFPFRGDDGTISFPIQSGGGWVWDKEYREGERLFPFVKFKGAWVYQKRCGCKPFQKIPEFYILRLKLGKEGPGLVIKLAVNGCYGKLAQSVGNAMFNQWIWAALITSGTRAQILQMLGLHKEWRNLLMVATDGIFSRENLPSPAPIPTGTGMLVDCGCKKECIHPNKKVAKPLGGWESKDIPNGMFLARPGIYFPLNPTKEQLGEIKGRGVGKKIVFDNWDRIAKSWAEHRDTKVVEVANVTRFCGAKTSISFSKAGFNRAAHTDGIHPHYGQWVQRKVDMGFNPLPKRQCINKDGVTLKLQSYSKKLMSTPYDAALGGSNPEAIMLKAATQEMMEQPDIDLREVEEWVNT